MNGFTAKWFGKLVSSLVKLNPQLKKAKELKKNKEWGDYKPFVDEQLYNWLNPFIYQRRIFNFYT